jgi:hypothetical protein
MSFKDSIDRMQKFAATLQAMDFPADWVYVSIDHGSTMLHRNAFLKEDPEDKQFVWVLTEHDGRHWCYEKSDLVTCAQFHPVKWFAR